MKTPRTPQSSSSHPSTDASAAARGAGSSVSEEIMRKLRNMYTHPDTGLVKMASMVGLKLLPPREKITVLLIGNHSAGKSSFINWYIGEHVLRVGVAMETTGIHFVTSGKRRETLTGLATLELYPHFKSLANHCKPDFISTEVSTSKARRFPLVTFVDTPGLVDGDMQYAFDIEATIAWLGSEADLILVLLDPMGQALCKRTLNVIEMLHTKKGLGAKMHFYLSKADEIALAKDCQRVLTQTTQSLCRRAGLNDYGFDLGTIFIPKEDANISASVNQIEEVCELFSRTISLTVQHALNDVDRHCEDVTAAMRAAVAKAELESGRARRQKSGSAAAVLMLLAVLAWGAGQLLLRVGLVPELPLVAAMPGLELQTLLLCVVLPLLLLLLVAKLWPGPPSLSAAQVLDLRRRIKDVEGVRKLKGSLYTEYLSDALSLQS